MLTDYLQALLRVDAVSLVIPTELHYKIRKEFLEAGIHSLLEKPRAALTAKANEKIRNV